MAITEVIIVLVGSVVLAQDVSSLAEAGLIYIYMRLVYDLEWSAVFCSLLLCSRLLLVKWSRFRHVFNLSDEVVMYC